MFKRTKRITALAVAAASIMSLVPAMAATRLATKDGTIENAVAFKDGKYLYEGYRTDDDNKGLYYNNGVNKDKPLDDADEFDTNYGKYDKDEYAVKDGNDKYIVNLSTGKISDDETAEDATTTAQAKLQTKLMKTDRYGHGADIKVSLNRTQKNRFGDIWYEYTATTAAGVTLDTKVTTADSAKVYTGYVNKSGATYIDCSNDANIYAYNGYKMVKLEEVGDTNTDRDHNATIKLDSIEHIRTLGQDDKYIYRLIKAHVSGAKAVGLGDNGKSHEDLYYVQKIAKSQGDKEKDAYLPKSTESYQLDSKANIGDGDVNDAWKALYDEDKNFERFTYIVDGAIYSTYRDDEKVKTIKMNLKTSQKLYKDNDPKKDKVDGHVVVKDTDKDTKIEDQNGNKEAWSVDINGNVWAIKDGEIKESTKCGDFKTVYTVDRSFDSLDVYDEDNLIAWNQDKEGYTTVTEGKKTAQDEAGTTTQPAAKTGWDQLADGTWNFYDATGLKAVNNWVLVGGSWYYFDANGSMTTAWQYVSGNWYYLNPNSDGSKGAMKTGWVNDNGTWYYLNYSGAMTTGWQYINGNWYYLNPNSDGTRGAMKTGWVNDNGTWYYLYSNGYMASNTVIGGYKLSASGALV